jgi:hypothetical protein
VHPIHSILYRHWLEIRSTLALCAIVTALATVLDVAIVLTDSTGARDHPIAFHGWLAGFVGLCAAITLGGTGVRTNDLVGGHPSRVFTLTLPVARSVWVLTRFALGLASAAGFLLGMLALVVLVALGIGSGASISGLATTTVLVTLATMGTQALIYMVQVWEETLAALSVVVLLFVFFTSASMAANDERTWPWILARVVERPPDLWTALTATSLILAGAIWMAVVLARRRDF